MQAIEILPVVLSDTQIQLLQPSHAESFVVGWPAGESPEIVAANALAALGLQPRVLHSTSWRHRGEEVVLTYLAVIETAEVPESWEMRRVGRTELARGDTTAPPPTIGIDQVVEHALRHLAWLLQDDPAIRKALPDWRDRLAHYAPEPFRALTKEK